MITPNPEIDEAALASLLGVRDELVFLPVGADSWSYRAGDVFVNVRHADGRRKSYSAPRDVAASLRAARTLRHEYGLEFILSPGVVEPFGRFVVSAYPYLEGTMSRETERRLDDVVRPWLERLHAVRAGLALASEDFVPDYADGLRDAIARAGAGPYRDRLRATIEQEHDRINVALKAHQRHGDTLRSRGIDLVVSHGEPAGNVLLCDDGRAFLVDLGDFKLAPRERDLMELGGGDEEIIGYYRRDYALSEVAEYTDRLSRPHTGDAEDDRAWHELNVFLAELP